MNIGETIKKLRRGKDMTQEQLAEYLNISTQAVSKWETNVSLPDITLIPPLANLFDTSADTLLGIDVFAKEKRIQDIVSRAENIQYNGYYAKAAKIYREGLKEYPDGFKLMNGLMNCLFRERDDQETKEKKDEMTGEVIRLGETILSECTDDCLRHNAIMILCFTYPESGLAEKAAALAKKMPGRWLSENYLLESVYSGTKRFETVRGNLLDDFDSLYHRMEFNFAPLDDGSRPYTTQEMIAILKKYLAIMDIVFEDNNYGFFRQTIARTHITLAVFYARLKNYDSAVESLRTAAEHSVKNDGEYDPALTYTCLLFRGMKFGGVLHNTAQNDSMYQLEEMKDPAFDPIRQNQVFIEIEVRLAKYAKMR